MTFITCQAVFAGYVAADSCALRDLQVAVNVVGQLQGSGLMNSMMTFLVVNILVKLIACEILMRTNVDSFPLA